MKYLSFLNELNFRLSSLQPFKTNDTDMPYYNSLLKDEEHAARKKKSVEVEWMSPQNYMKAVKEGFNSDPYSATDKALVEKYMKLMESGTKFPLPVLEYGAKGFFTQEGRHRAQAAENLNINKIPVLIVKDLEVSSAESLPEDYKKWKKGYVFKNPDNSPKAFSYNKDDFTINFYMNKNDYSLSEGYSLLTRSKIDNKTTEEVIEEVEEFIKERDSMEKAFPKSLGDWYQNLFSERKPYATYKKRNGDTATFNFESKTYDLFLNGGKDYSNGTLNSYDQVIEILEKN